MSEKSEKEELSIDILKHLEDLSNEVNKIMASRARAVFRRYPVTFGLLILLGVIAVHEGVKGLIKSFGLLDINPWYLVIFGLTLLAITGKLYKKLEK
ncbi:hypothetical protein A3C67_01755 [Candidatus Nomurabacteria bacterium RIFCSPHIGHO2_02_FULL_42_19]|uniref:Uncharacterized protein n=1 Tax=Candidatus Nomurabacteria bacterium RIFCSPHIGHO2_02_FULL_42_19 TaxID=1801756 RepID=A0A1F6W3N0_9BACT|nr:MAG: hypothetical protein A3C67_01755 [Candidatus Nomurabacteria bacterium RIFCSPHIGHO2_02_FULL_42_19]